MKEIFPKISIIKGFIVVLFLDKVAISSPKLSHTAILIKRHKVLNNAIFRFIYCSLPKNAPVQEKKNNLFGFFEKAHGQTFLLKKNENY